MKKLICKKCGNEVLPEKDKALKKEYPYYPASVRSEDFGVWSGSMKKKEDCFLHGWKRKAKYRLKTRLD